jgi:hypothetical protein
MDIRHGTWILAAALLTHCGRGAGGGAASQTSSGSAGTPVEVTLEPASVETLAQEDRVSASDNPAPDGRPDARFTAQIRGRVAGLILTICDDLGTHASTQWDTVVGQDALPPGFVHRLGTETWVLGVVDPQGRLLNNGDGSLPEQNFERPTTLRLYASMREALQPGRMVCLTVLRPEGDPVRATAELR